MAPASIRWSTTQIKRWGSCTLDTREIRISARLRVVPEWVLDAVIVHELAHLLEPTHSARFRQLEQRYPRRDEADVFLEGYALGLHMPGAGEDAPDEGCASQADGTDRLITTSAAAGDDCRVWSGQPGCR